MNKQSQTADKGSSSSLDIGQGLVTPHSKELACYDYMQWKMGMREK
jgi:hypothetical protein